MGEGGLCLCFVWLRFAALRSAWRCSSSLPFPSLPPPPGHLLPLTHLPPLPLCPLLCRRRRRRRRRLLLCLGLLRLGFLHGEPAVAGAGEAVNLG